MKHLITTTAMAALVLSSAAHADLKPFANIKNSHQQMARIDTDEANKVFIGGGKNNARDQVGEEFAEITGGTNIDFNHKNPNRIRDELTPMLQAILTSDKNEAPGLEGVTLVSLSEDSFTISIPGWFGTQNFIEFTGSKAEEAVANVLFELGNGSPAVNFKNSASQVTVFNTNETGSIFSGSAGALDDDTRAIVGGSTFNIPEAEDVLDAALFGSGIGGVEILGLTDEGVTMRFNGQAGTVDTIIMNGAGTMDMLGRVDNTWVDTKDKDSEFAIFDVTKGNRPSLFIGGGGSDTAEFQSIVEGSFIQADEVLHIFRAIITGNGRKDEHGLDGVELIGLNSTSFAIAITNTRSAVDYVLFTNVDQLEDEGAADLGFFSAGDED
ncbi:MAG: hypothetical protein AAGH41_04545 [Pseudomonadota bacterium]